MEGNAEWNETINSFAVNFKPNYAKYVNALIRINCTFSPVSCPAAGWCWLPHSLCVLCEIYEMSSGRKIKMSPLNGKGNANLCPAQSPTNLNEMVNPLKNVKQFPKGVPKGCTLYVHIVRSSKPANQWMSGKTFIQRISIYKLYFEMPRITVWHVPDHLNLLNFFLCRTIRLFSTEKYPVMSQLVTASSENFDTSN